jgi:hypothetical protein
LQLPLRLKTFDLHILDSMFQFPAVVLHAAREHLAMFPLHAQSTLLFNFIHLHLMLLFHFLLAPGLVLGAG